MEKIFSIKERILHFAKFQGISIETFLHSIGMTYGSFKGNAKKMSINSDALEQIYTLYPNINLKWLLTGEGDMIITNRPADSGEICHGCIEKDKTIKSLNFTIELLQDKISDLKQKKLYMQSEDITSIAAEPVAELAKKQAGRR